MEKHKIFPLFYPKACKFTINSLYLHAETQVLITKNTFVMSKVFRLTPKRIKRTNGLVLTPEMSIIVTTRSHTSTPFYNGAEEVKEQYMRMYQFDYKKACCSANDFDIEK